MKKEKKIFIEKKRKYRMNTKSEKIQYEYKNQSIKKNIKYNSFT